jgi:hypothetical protein
LVVTVASKNHVGKIRAKNSIVGDHGRLTDKSKTHALSAEQSALQADALRQLREIISLLPAYARDIDIGRARECAAKAETALKRRRLSRGQIEKHLKGILVAAGGITVLADAVGAVQATVARIIS